MQLKLEHCLLYAVTDTSWLRGRTLARQVEEALRGGATMVQLREKKLTGDALEQEAREILALCRRYDVPLLINDDVLLAKKIGADGVHVGQSDMAAAQARSILGPDAIIGVTARTVEQARAAEAAGADYLGSGAVFGTSTKKDAKPLDPACFQEICESVSIPVTAIGGITLENIRQLKGRGMRGFAIVSGIFAADDIEAQTGKLWKAAQSLCVNDDENVSGLFMDRIRTARPVVQCITNIVTVNDCANALLAVGASPTMAHHPREMEDFARVTDALVCNMGATESLEAMLLAAPEAAKRGHPVVIDPVGCAASAFRREKVLELVDALHAASAAGSSGTGCRDDACSSDTGCTDGTCSSDAGCTDAACSSGGCTEGTPGGRGTSLCIRGNAAEIRALVEHHNTGRGVDDFHDLPETGEDPDVDPIRYAVRLARDTGAIVVQSGETDYITDGRRLYTVHGGSAWMARVTGTGCMLSSLLGAFLCVENSALAAAACCRFMNACAEQAAAAAAREGGGSGTFHIRLLDALSGPVGL
ncbi:MAG: thiamine phosphate synthase [Sarcina sp.]|nr:thiamine phosphate synthase [Sarcina sp.]